MKKTKKTKQKIFRLPLDIIKKLEDHSKKTGIPQNFLVTQVLAQLVSNL